MLTQGFRDHECMPSTFWSLWTCYIAKNVRGMSSMMEVTLEHRLVHAVITSSMPFMFTGNDWVVLASAPSLFAFDKWACKRG